MEYSEFEKSVAKELSMYPFVKWQNKKTRNLVKRLFKQGYSVKQTVQFCILNN